LDSSYPLISTKLHRPRVVSDLVERPRLVEKLNRGQNRKLALVVAPAGYGKSTLVAEWLETHERPWTWLSLDENDSNLTVVLNYLIAAVHNIFPKPNWETSTLLQSSESPQTPVLIRTFINELDRIEHPFTLILDDYHLIREAEVHTLMGELLRHPPRALHLVLISRLNPPLNLMQLRASGQMVEIRAQDLSFTTRETADFLQKAAGTPVDEETAGLLQKKTEGWVTGLRLSLLSLRRPEDIDKLPGSLPGERLTTEYLFQEVLENQSPEIRESLLKTSIFNRFCAPLYDAVIKDDSDGRQVLSGDGFIDWLTRANLFSISLDNQHLWHRYHHLFRHLLQRQLEQRFDSESIALLHHSASDWFAQNGFIEEAIHHALAADNPGLAGDIIAQHKDKLLDADHHNILERWLSYLPNEVINQRPGLLLIQLWLHEFHYDFEPIPPLLQQLDDLLEAKTVDLATLGQREFFQGVPLFWQGQAQPSMEHFERSLALTPPENESVRASVTLYLAVAKQMAGLGEETARTYQMWLNQERKDSVLKGRLLGALVFVHYLSGQLAPVSYYANQLLELGQRLDNAFILGWSHFVLGHIHFDWQMLDVAASHFSQAIRYKHFLDRIPRVESYFGLALSYQGLGRGEEADQIMQQFMIDTEEYPNPGSALFARSAQMRLAILRNDMEKVRYLQHVIDFSSDRGTMLFWLELPRITECRFFIAQGTPSSLKKAVRLLTEHLQFARSTHNVLQQIVILPLLAAAYEKLNQRQKAIQTLSDAVTLAEPGGLIHPFLEPAPEMIRLFGRLKQRGETREFISQIINALPTPPSDGSRTGQTQLLDPLTDREMDVLSLLAQRYSNKEIATRLYITPATVKRHTVNIYQKLEVNGRRQAVERAMALGILPAT